jgi:hypothetical protein
VIYLIPPSKSLNLTGPVILISSSLTSPKNFHHENMPQIKQQWPYSHTDGENTLPYQQIKTEGEAEIQECKYSRIPLIWHQWDQKGVGISNILHYQSLIILT